MKLYSLFQKKVFHIEPGLERIKKACEELGNPQENFPSILVSGTNGKGSTCVFLESLFREHGLKTGLFTSPHLVKENERWQVNRKEITDEKLQQYIETLVPVIKKYNLTYFEASTLLAFKYFSDEKIDIAVLEVGLGGRWDSTNIVEPEVSVITNVSLDHTHLLGDTLEKIAEEKAGICRKNRPTVIGSEQMELISKVILKGVKEIYHYPIGFSYKKTGINSFDYIFKGKKFKNLEISMPGDRQIQNASTALTAFLIYCEKKGLTYSQEKIKQALRKTFWSGRMEIVSKNPFTVVDGAHNEDAVLKTFKEIKELFPDKKIITLYSGMKDKNWKKILNTVSSFSEKVILTQINVSRGLKKEDFKDIPFPFFENVKDALEYASSIYSDDKLILVIGSLYLVGEVLSANHVK